MRLRRRGSSYSFYLSDTDIKNLDALVDYLQEQDTNARINHSSAVKEAIELLYNKYFPNTEE